MKLRWHGIPTNKYDHYKGEFEFEVDLEKRPDFFRTQGNFQYHSENSTQELAYAADDESTPLLFS